MPNQTVSREQIDASLDAWKDQELKTIELQKLTGILKFEKSVDLILFRQNIYDNRTSQIISRHDLALEYIKEPLTLEVSLALAIAISKIENLNPSKIDLGKLGVEWVRERTDFENIQEFVHFKLKNFIIQNQVELESKDVILYGFGRIGRLAARMLISATGKGSQLRLKAIVLRPKMEDRMEEAKKRAALLMSDTVHGDFGGKVSVSQGGTEMIVNGNKIQLIFAKVPEDIDYTKYGIQNAIVIDNTGAFRDKAALSRHLRPGVDKIVLTAPGKNIPNIVVGANQKKINLEADQIISAASCTTNAIVPVLKTINDVLHIEKGHIETIHSYTNDQNLIDNFHKKPRRGKGAPTNMVITTTGAAKAVSVVLPELKGVLTGNAIRVPTPNVSLAILNLTIKTNTSLQELNALLKEASFHGPFLEQIKYSTSTEFVSSNAIGMSSTSVVDAPSTIVSKDGKNITVYLWYDNEYGYTSQVIRLAKYFAKVRRNVYY